MNCFPAMGPEVTFNQPVRVTFSMIPVAAPVIAVPTSVGYGASFGGVAALLGMLNTCSPNVCVVNIDNGFGAAYVAAMMLRGAAASESSAREAAASSMR